ncbi:caspase family protein [Rhodopirellula sallentina]|uniref:caspase family protein n=1 Tax=Rhodopirellula sallentina TaxID=1263869 RepID=UPI000A2EE739|nr:caspase family protein [Rhodopirellula sallentina]
MPISSNLPSESLLPATGRVARLTQPPFGNRDEPLESTNSGERPNQHLNNTPVTMPPESSLPGQFVGDLPGDDAASGNEPLSGNDDTAVPRDSRARTDVGDGEERETNADDRFDQEMMGEDRPILRLNYAGHTGRIRTIAISDDGDRLVTGGDDKDAHVWQRDPRDNRKWIHQRAIRWQVWRGPRGAIYDTDISSNRVALAGYGAMGGTGEVWVARLSNGKWIRTLFDYENAHRQAVDTVAWADDGKRLASADLAGRVVVWQPDQSTGLWKSLNVVDEDRGRLSESDANRLRSFRGFHPLVWSGDEIVSAHFVRFHSGAVPYPVWQLKATRSDGERTRMVSSAEIPGLITDLDVSGDGNTVAAACYSTRSVRVYQKSPAGDWSAMREISVPGRPLWVRLQSDGTHLMIATEAESGAKPLSASVSIHDLRSTTSAVLSQVSLAETPSAGIFDPIEGTVILAVGARLQIHSLSDEGAMARTPTQIIQTPTSPITRIAVAKGSGTPRVGISRSNEQGKRIEEAFDLRQMSLDTRRGDDESFDDDDYLTPQRLPQKWSLRSSADAVNTYDWYVDDSRVGRFELNPNRHGRPVSISTFNPPEGEDALLIVGTDGSNGVYVYSIAKKTNQKTISTPRLKRWFRGHSGAVRSTSATGTGDYLFSGGDDGLVNAWNLKDVLTASDGVNRWGGELDADAIVDEIDEAGPWYFRGVRVGDRLMRISWPGEDGSDRDATKPNEILDALQNVPLETQVVFEFERQGELIGRFQMFPAWYPLATIMIDAQREWALWTPSGIYNASLMGNRRFGWQLNRGLGEDVDFYTADQFEKSLERPNVMRRLFDAGSLASAMRLSVGGGPPPGENAIVNQIRTRPQIEIVTPEDGQIVLGDSLGVTARVVETPGVPLAMVRAFVDGIPGEEIRRDVDEFEWRFRLPRQGRMELKVIAVSESGSSSSESIWLSRPSEDIETPTLVKPRMHVFGVGVGKYADANIQSLDFPAAATTTVANTFRDLAGKHYEVTTQQLVDRDATRPLFNIYAEATVQQLREKVGPDDVVVLYLCGHGLRDRRTGRWYFVTADASYRDLMDDQYQDCLSMSDLSHFSSLPCRKLAILDSCHSGAVQTSLRGDDLKAALRHLQQDRVITLTASEGGEEAAEVAETGMGRFTYRFVEALRGAADQDGNGIVTLDETYRYVSETVSADARADSMQQHPTASPVDLIQRLDLPLTSL